MANVNPLESDTNMASPSQNSPAGGQTKQNPTTENLQTGPVVRVFDQLTYRPQFNNLSCFSS